MAKFDFIKFCVNVFPFFVGAAIGACIITPFKIMEESRKVRDALNESTERITWALSKNTIATLYPEDVRKDIEKQLDESKKTEK